MDMALARRGSRAIEVAGVTYRWAVSPNDGASYRSRIMSSNGGELEIAGEPWFLHPALDDSDTERLRRSWDDVVRQKQLARSWRDFSENAVSLADNGCWTSRGPASRRAGCRSATSSAQPSATAQAITASSPIGCSPVATLSSSGGMSSIVMRPDGMLCRRAGPRSPCLSQSHRVTSKLPSRSWDVDFQPRTAPE